MSGPSYARVATEPVELAEVSLEGDLRDTAGAAASASAASAEGVSSRPSLTKRAVYSAHRVESRTPRVPGETDEAFKRRVNVAYVNALLHSLAWVAAAALILYYTDMWNIVRYDTRINHTFLGLASMSGFVLIMVIAYLALWVPMMATRPIVDLGAHAPTAAPVGAAAGVATFIFLVIALWPIWGFVTLPIMIVLSFAACLGPNLLPF